MSATGKSASAILSVASIIVTFAAAMTAIWFFTHSRDALGAYNLAIAAVSTLTFIAVRVGATG